MWQQLFASILLGTEVEKYAVQSYTDSSVASGVCENGKKNDLNDTRKRTLASFKGIREMT